MKSDKRKGLSLRKLATLAVALAIISLSVLGILMLGNLVFITNLPSPYHKVERVEDVFYPTQVDNSNFTVYMETKLYWFWLWADDVISLYIYCEDQIINDENMMGGGFVVNIPDNVTAGNFTFTFRGSGLIIMVEHEPYYQLNERGAYEFNMDRQIFSFEYGGHPNDRGIRIDSEKGLKAYLFDEELHLVDADESADGSAILSPGAPLASSFVVLMGNGGHVTMRLTNQTGDEFKGAVAVILMFVIVVVVAYLVIFMIPRSSRKKERGKSGRK
jgi:hypothetical protein